LISLVVFGGPRVEGEYVGFAVLDGCGREDAVILEEGLDVFGIRDF